MKQLDEKALKVLTYFFENPREEVYLRELARQLRMSPATVMRALRILTKEGLVAKRTEKHATYFRANPNPYFRELKKAYTVFKILRSGILELLKEKSAGLSSILLYGSAAKGEDDRESDYDFLVIAARCAVKGRELSKLLGKESTLQVFDAAGWKRVAKRNRAFYLEVISNSIVLYGEKPVID
jgi:predicted nucleotidyltransferase